LISLEVLDFGGYKYTGQGGSRKVSKDSLVVMKATKVDNLYNSKGSIEVTYEVRDVASCIWQKKQGHMNKKELQVLVSSKLFLDLEFCF
jgi:hypothetical protein